MSGFPGQMGEPWYSQPLSPSGDGRQRCCLNDGQEDGCNLRLELGGVGVKQGQNHEALSSSREQRQSVDGKRAHRRTHWECATVCFVSLTGSGLT